MERTDYGFRTTVARPYEETVKLVKDELKAEGFGVLTEVDVAKVMGEKLNVEFRPYTIIGACNPPLSHRAFTTDLDAGLVLPCNVIIYDDNGKSAVVIADPVVMIGVLGNPSLADVAREAQEKLKRVASRIDAGDTP